MASELIQSKSQSFQTSTRPYTSLALHDSDLCSHKPHPPCSFLSWHSSLLAVPQTLGAHSHLRALILAVFSAGNALPQNTCMVGPLTILESFLKCYPLYKAFPGCSVYLINPAVTHSIRSPPTILYILLISSSSTPMRAP